MQAAHLTASQALNLAARRKGQYRCAGKYVRMSYSSAGEGCIVSSLGEGFTSYHPNIKFSYSGGDCHHQAQHAIRWHL